MKIISKRGAHVKTDATKIAVGVCKGLRYAAFAILGTVVLAGDGIVKTYATVLLAAGGLAGVWALIRLADWLEEEIKRHGSTNDLWA